MGYSLACAGDGISRHMNSMATSCPIWCTGCVESRHEQFPVTRGEHGTVLVSGASPTMFHMVVSQDVTPESLMLSVLNGERYAKIYA